MPSKVSGIKTGKPTHAGTPASVVAKIDQGYPKQEALSMGPKPRSSVKVK